MYQALLWELWIQRQMRNNYSKDGRSAQTRQVRPYPQDAVSWGGGVRGRVGEARSSTDKPRE